MAGDYTTEVLVRALARFLAEHSPNLETSSGARWLETVEASRARAAQLLGALPARPPTFCIGCPERPVFSAMKLVAEDVGRPHISVDVGCHAFATFEPFSQGNTPARPVSVRCPRAGRSRSWATEDSGTTDCSRVSPPTSSITATRFS
jgi:indolepyruvate ferredoxin oxidoreductase alpha subunit